MKSPKNTYDVDGIPDRTPIRMLPRKYYISITNTEDLDCFPRWPLTPVPDILINRPNILERQLERLRKWRQKRFFEEIYFITTIWEKGNRSLFRPGFSEEDIVAIRRLKHQAYGNDAYLKYLTKSEDDNGYFAGFTDQEQQEVEREIQQERQDANKKRKAVRLEEDETKRLAMSEPGDSERFFEFDFERISRSQTLGRPIRAPGRCISCGSVLEY
ncbi:uncharacterized protein BDV17DRAFT_287990 [Aspergillus undulatus]|uniref:uncharacterized protein n=1 Tax=Aspergillus undulatus TaxID=1810928 RepID=UPI003CCDB32D